MESEKKMRKSRKGIVELSVWVPLLFVLTVSFVFMVFVYQNVAASRAMAGADVTSSELGMEMEAAYSAPEDVNVIHEVDVGEGYPVIGSVLISHKKREICTSKYSQDDMYLYVMNAGFTAAGLGAVKSLGWKYRRQIIKGLKTAKDAIYWIRPWNWITLKAPKRILESILKRTIGNPVKRKISQIFAERAAKRAAKKASGQLLRQRAGRWISAKISRIIGKVIVDKIKSAFSSAARFVKLAVKVVRAFFKGIVKYMIGRTSQQEIQAATEVTLDKTPHPAGPIIAKVVAALGTAADFYFVLAPIYQTIEDGHEASDDLLEESACYTYVSKKDDLYVGPPNCESKVKHVDVDLTGMKFWGLPIGKAYDLALTLDPSYYILRESSEALGRKVDLKKPPLFPISEPKLGSKLEPPEKMEVIGEKCQDAPHALISYNDPMSELRIIVNEVFTPGGAHGEHRVSKASAHAFFTVPYGVCTAMEFIPKFTSKGTKCKKSLFVAWIVLYYAWPEQFFTMLWGTNIWPSEEYYYMQYPLYININEYYNRETTETKLTVEKTFGG